MEASASAQSRGIFDSGNLEDMTIAILRDEQGHRRLFEGFLREYELGGGRLSERPRPVDIQGPLRALDRFQQRHASLAVPVAAVKKQRFGPGCKRVVGPRTRNSPARIPAAFTASTVPARVRRPTAACGGEASGPAEA
jgi:hypothetical protein